MVQNNVLFEIGTFASGADFGLAGYTDYKRYENAADLESSISDFTGTGAPHNPKNRPTRLGKPGGQFDSSLSLLDERGENRYAFIFDDYSRAKFAENPPIIAIPLIWEGRSVDCLRDISLQTIAGHDVASFVFDRSTIPNSLIEAVRKSGHSTAIKIPFYFNMVDAVTQFQPWIIDDHRYQPSVGWSHFEAESQDHDHDHDHDHEDGALKVINNHGGIHPPGSMMLGNNIMNHGGIHPPGKRGWRNHGGIHPPGVTSFLIVELP
jgi:hypothetical protein